MFSLTWDSGLTHSDRQKDYLGRGGLAGVGERAGEDDGGERLGSPTFLHSATDCSLCRGGALGNSPSTLGWYCAGLL